MLPAFLICFLNRWVPYHLTSEYQCTSTARNFNSQSKKSSKQPFQWAIKQSCDGWE